MKRVRAQGAIVAALSLAAAAAVAQDGKARAPANQAATSPQWAQTVSREPAGQAAELDKKQLDIVHKVNQYFNQMTGIKGTFVQTGSDHKRMKGKFYVKKPGRFRFEYSPPSKLIIISDGEYLSIQDLDLKTDDRVALDQTPFRVLLRKEVDLIRDAQVSNVEDVDDVLVLALQDKSPDNPGRIKLFLAKKPTLELREWITTDPQGLDTRMELSDVTKADDFDPNLFRPAPVALQKLQ
jgi:outer membrane lipoprotein-sorting protein